MKLPDYPEDIRVAGLPECVCRSILAAARDQADKRAVAPQEEAIVWTASVSDSKAPRAPASLETMEPDPGPDVPVLLRADRACAHDPALLVAALEEIEARRAAIEWLLDAELLCRCLV